MVKAARRLYRVEGMDCAEETSALRRELEPLSGVQSVSFDLLQGRMTVVADDEQVRDADVAAAAARAGLRAEPWTEAAGARRLHLRGTVLSAAGVLGGLGLSLAGGPGVPLYARGVYALGVVAGLWQVLPKALAALRRLRPDMNLLMCVAVAGAMALDEWFEAGTVAALFSLSLTLEAWSVGRARRAIGTLLELAPTETTRLEGGREVSVPVDQVRAGDRVLVKPGSRVPLDGTIVSGETEVDQSPVTGESLPVPKGPGDFLYAGSVNGSAAVELEVDRPASKSTLAHIARLVEEAREQSSPSELWVERFARVYTPAVMLLALLVMLLPPLLWGAPWDKWTYSALVLLVIACPCALVISTPVSIVAGLTSAARHGVLVKSGRHLETPARLRAFAFDKTGTLTWGRPKVVEVVPLDGHTEEELLARAAAVEARSEHPIAQAILSAAEERGVEAVAATNVRAVSGRGAEGSFDGRPFWVGSHRWLEERGRETEDVHARIEALSGAGRSVVVVGNDRHVCGLLAVADEVRPDAAQVVAALKQAGIVVAMVTGDNRPTALAIAEATGIDRVEAEVLPEEKVAAIAALEEEYGCVGMVGDGVNDAPALARATLGVAMGAAGTAVAIETADVALMSDDLQKLPWLVRHSRRTLGIIRQNVVASLAVKALFVVLTFAGPASLWSAIAADMGVSLAVVFNALRLLHD